MMINSKLPTKIRYKVRMSPLTITFHYCTGSSTKYNRTRKTSKSTQSGKEKIKLSLLPEDMIIYIENPKELTKEL